MTKLEQCARALYVREMEQACGAYYEADWGEAWDAQAAMPLSGKLFVERWSNDVLAIIEALYEPNEEMLKAARDYPLPLVLLDSAIARENLGIVTRWQTMLNTIRREG